MIAQNPTVKMGEEVARMAAEDYAKRGARPSAAACTDLLLPKLGVFLPPANGTLGIGTIFDADLSNTNGAGS